MEEATIENLLIALAAGILTGVVTFATFQYIRPGINALVITKDKKVTIKKKK